MTAEERNEKIKKFFESDMELLSKKGHDYSGDEDAMRNLREFGMFGILVRLSDKYSRLKTLIGKNATPKVRDESLLDTLRDIRIYCYLAQVLMEEVGDKFWDNPKEAIIEYLIPIR